MANLADGESVQVEGNHGTYTLKNVGGVYSCTCMAWRNQHEPPERRTCKHIKEMRGERAETERIAAAFERAGMNAPVVSPKWVPAKSGEKGAVASRERLGSEHSKTGYYKRVESPSNNKPAKVIVWKPMLAEKWTEDVDPTGHWMSEKEDGVRAKWDGKTLWSRQSNKFYAPEWFTKNFPPFPLDGELFSGRGKFQSTVSIVRRQDAGDQWKKIKYVVFGSPEDGMTFEEGMEKINNWYENHEVAYSVVLPQIKCKSREHLQKMLDEILKKGGEGVMLRKAGSPYEHKRSNLLLKVKVMQDAEARVIGHTVGTGKYISGMVGALECELPNGKKFKVGTGLSDEDRRNPPAIGSVITFRYQELTNDGIPRFPAFDRVREDVNWEELSLREDFKKSVPTFKYNVGIKIEMHGNAKIPKSNPPPLLMEGEGHDFSVIKQNITRVRELEKESKKEVKTQVNNKMSNGKIIITVERYEYVNAAENSAKFWELIVQGAKVITRYGKIGSAGKDAPKEFASVEEATKFANKMRKEKINKGYKLIASDAEVDR